MSERMSDVEIKGHLHKIGLLVQIATSIPVDELLHEISLNDALGPVLAPTEWLAIRDNQIKNERVLRALGAFVKEAHEAYPEFKAVPS